MLIYQYILDFFKILLIVILSGIIGYNRERNGMIVGIRTHVLVGLSAVLLQIISYRYFLHIPNGGDPSRLGGQMLTGIGFLGAGSILKDNKNIRGLTTAASIFFVACIGLGVGFGEYVISITVTIIGYLFLSDVFKLKRFISEKRTSSFTILIGYTESDIFNTNNIINILNENDIEILNMDLTKNSNTVNLTLKLLISDEISINYIISELSKIKDINLIKTIQKK